MLDQSKEYSVPKRVIFFAMLSLFFILSVCTAQTPSKILTQSLLDRFVKDLSPIVSDPVVAAARDTATQTVLMEAITNPASGIMMGENFFTDFYHMQKAIFGEMKTHSDVNAALKKQNWNNEFWDIYLVMAIGLPYAHNQEILDNPELADSTSGFDMSEMPPSENFIHPDDMALIRKNYGHITDLIGEEISRNNGY